jgi:hypothetical protein
LNVNDSLLLYNRILLIMTMLSHVMESIGIDIRHPPSRFFQERFHDLVPALSKWSGTVVGLTLMAIGLMGIYETYFEAPEAEEDEEQQLKLAVAGELTVLAVAGELTVLDSSAAAPRLGLAGAAAAAGAAGAAAAAAAAVPVDLKVLGQLPSTLTYCRLGLVPGVMWCGGAARWWKFRQSRWR